ncbi:MAG: hypothetical protein CME64_15660 [Halobacteriovoraceae bacterium]|nr:hypothetical protein [Halobacteriovoraceae bacterium]|tara:strand:- start:181530 stop:181913 length:384 start_codon:yes stop_codon:yes gene_type:complete
MIGIIFKSTIAFSVSYILLSFQINDAYIFDHLNRITGPVGTNIQMVLSDSASHTWDKTKTYGKQVFNNSRPQDLEATIEDTVDKTQSALKKRLPKAQRFVKESQESFLEELRKEEKDGLSKIIMENE